jgi:putative transposase
MRKSKFSESQIVAILKESDSGLAVADVLRNHCISSATFYKWRSKYGNLRGSELQRIKDLEQQLADLKANVSDLTLENAAMRRLCAKYAQTTAEKRAAVDCLVQDGRLSAKQACSCIGLSRASYYRKPIDKAIIDAPVIDELNTIIATHPHWGFRKCFDQLRRHGHPWNHKRVWRIYQAIRVNMPRRNKK